MVLEYVKIGSGELKGGWTGCKEDYHYNVPPDAIAVTFESANPDTAEISFADRTLGKASLNWEKGNTTCRVGAWAEGGWGGNNRVTWTVYAVLRF